MSLSNDMDKSWNHPWTTKEMRETRREWSLAGDVGLLNHLQQFSESLMSKMSKTQDSLDKLTTQLNEAAIFIDNVTNTSLALANTQFIESLVQEDDAEVSKNSEELQEDLGDQNSAANVIATVSESVRHGLCIMEEKYKTVEVIDSDSDDEDAAFVLCIILERNNSYRHRPLPYVIGTEKWKASDKIGLESSSSESEQVDEEDEESESDKDNQMLHRAIDSNNGSKCNVDRLSSSLSSSEMENYNEPSNNVSYVNNEKLDTISQVTLNSESESVTPVKNLLKGVSDATPNFAAELAKRLGTVRQIQNPIPADEITEPSINRFKDDLFKPEKEDENKISPKPERWLSKNNDLFSDDVSKNFWKEQPQKSYTQNVIPPSIDVPPPIDITSTKPKSAIDDLFGDGDSDDSDDIFLSKSTMKKITKENPSGNNALTNFFDDQQNFLDIVAPEITSNVATSTPETNSNIASLFSDKEEKDTDLFGAPKKPLQKFTDASSSGVSDSNKGKPLDEDSKVSDDIRNFDTSKKLMSGSSQYKSSSLSATDVSKSNNGGKLEQDIGTRGSEHSLIVAEGRVSNIVVSTGNSSGISTQQISVSSNAESSTGVDFTSPELTSTRLKSEEIYRERIASDSLFGTQTPQNPWPSSSGNGMPISERDEGCGGEVLSSNKLDDVFENEDLFGPPPLPKADSKIGKAKVTSLFDESDSGDELFSTTSSGSRSQKSTDFFVTAPQNPEKSKFNAPRKVFVDNDIDIFGSKSSSDVDIFGIVPKQRYASKTSPQEENTSQNILEERFREQTLSKSSASSNVRNTGTTLLKSSIFDEDDNIDNDLFGISSLKTEKIVQGAVLKDSDNENLFLSKKQEKGIVFNEKVVLKNEKSIVIAQGDEVSISTTNDADKETNTADSTTLKPSGHEFFSSSTKGNDFSLKDENSDDNLFDNKKMSSADHGTENQKKCEFLEDVNFEEKSSQLKSGAVEFENPPEATLYPTSSSDDTAHIPPSLKAKEKDKKDLFESKREGDRGNKRHPPNTLNIKSTNSTLEESGQTSRRVVSGKIKDLMGKMGDLKILSPTDTPPLLKKVDGKIDDECDSTDKDSDDGRSVSIPNIDTGPPFTDKNPMCASSPPSSHDGNVEVAISFDEPVQVETLSIAASKSRAKIRAKRRPQSRHARKSALQQSGISFDTVDDVDELQSNRGVGSDISSKDSITNFLSTSSSKPSIAVVSADRLSMPSMSAVDNDRVGEANLSTATEDRSEVCSLSKESSMSANKNTLLSPSTDEEDLFDVPPDLPEDPQKEDTLFGRAPILSPVEGLFKEKSIDTKLLKSTAIRESSTHEEILTNTKCGETDNNYTLDTATLSNQRDEFHNKSHFHVTNNKDSVYDKDPANKLTTVEQEKNDLRRKSAEGLRDPLTDNNHDPLKDPSQLFAFVTKTPSPEKGRSLLFPEDCSLFAGQKLDSEHSTKQPLDLFTDDTKEDLFSSSLVKPVKKSSKDSTSGLFDDDIQNDEDDSLFGSVTKINTFKTDSQKPLQIQESQKKINIFEDDEDDFNLFVAVEKSQRAQNIDREIIPEEKISTNVKPILTSKSSEYLDDKKEIFVTKKIAPKTAAASTSLFLLDDEDEDDQIFAKSSLSFSSSVTESEQKTVKDKSATVKKVVTRDLKKTAEKIMEDPLSLLQDD